MNTPMNDMSIETLHRTKTGKISDKWASYLPYYDSLFLHLRNNKIRMLEIGVQNGGSLETWSKYFQNAALFIGCDIDPKCASLSFVDSRINVVVGDANISTTYSKIFEMSPQFDIIIDDGSHISNDILNSFINYFPLLSADGIYVVEDACCLFMNDFGGGILNEFGAYSFFKKVADIVNFQFWRDDITINNYMRTFFDLKSTPSFILDGWIESIEFRNSVITIKKASRPGHDKLGERIVVGSDAQVQNWGGNLPR